MVVPSSTSSSCPSMLTSTLRLGKPTNTLSAIARDDLELNNSGRDRVGRGLAEPADRSVSHGLGDVAQQTDVPFLVRIARAKQAMQDLFLPHCADSTRDALTACLVAKDPCDTQQDLLHVGRVVEHDDRARPERGADRAR